MKINQIFLCLTTFLLCNCSNSNNTISEINDNSENKTENSITSSDNNIKVVYFSCTNNTKKIANQISSYLECQIEEITPTIPYSNDDLNYNNNSSRANKEQNDADSRPEIKNQINFEDINTLFLGYPIWWGKLPKIIYTFLDEYDFTNYTIIPFCTSGGSDISTSVSEIKKLELNATVLDGKRFAANANDNEVRSFVDSLNL